MKFLSSSFVKNIDFTVSFLKKMRIKKLVYGTMKPSKIGGGFMNQYNIIVQQLSNAAQADCPTSNVMRNSVNI